MNDLDALGAIVLLGLLVVVNELLTGDARLMVLGLGGLCLMGWLWRSIRT